MRFDDENLTIRINEYGSRIVFGDLETEIMEAVWLHEGPVAVRDIYVLLAKSRKIAYTTVMTTMNRLAEKNALRVVGTVGLANQFSPSMPRDEFFAEMVGHIVKVLFREFPAETQASLLRLGNPAGSMQK